MGKKNHISIFIIEDDRMFTRALQREIESAFSRFNVQISTFDSAEIAAMHLSEKPDIAIIDYHLDSKYPQAMNGVDSINMIRRRSPYTEVLMLTGEDSVDVAIQAMQNGAHDYIVKNEHVFRKLNIALLQCLKFSKLKHKLDEQRKMSLVALAATALLLGTAVAFKLLSPGIF